MNDALHSNTQAANVLDESGKVSQKERFMVEMWNISSGMNRISKLPQAVRLVYSSPAPQVTSSLSLIILHLQDNKIFWPEIIHSRLRLKSQGAALSAANLSDRSKVAFFSALLAGISVPEPRSEIPSGHICVLR